MTPPEIAELKKEVRKLLHNLTNCQQSVLGYFELGEYRKAYIMSLDCRSQYATVAAKLSQLDAEEHD